MTLQDALAINGHPLNSAELVAADLYEWQPTEISCVPEPEAVSVTLSINDVPLGPPSTTFGDPLWRWRWNPQHAVGIFQGRLQLSYADGRTATAAFELRVRPGKLDLDQYQTLLTAVQREAHAIVYALSGGREGAASGLVAGQTLVEELFALVDTHVREAVALASLIGARPHQQLLRQHKATPLAEVERLGPAALADLLRSPLDDVANDVLPDLQAALRPPGLPSGGLLPRTVAAPQSASTPDIVEHRLLRHVLQELARRVAYVRELTRRELARRQRNAGLIDGPQALLVGQSWVERTTQAMRKLRQALAAPWLAEVGGPATLQSPTGLMLRDPRYRRLFALYQAMRTRPVIAFDSPTMWLPIQELPSLYEQWCALRLVRTLLPLGHVEAQQLVESMPDAAMPAERRWTLRLQHTQPLLVLRLPNQTRLDVWYQRRYRPQTSGGGQLGALDPFTRVPDLAVEVFRPGAEPQVLIFDAKYRVAPDGSVPQDALDDAYAYRSAIGLAATRATLGAFLLFPGNKGLITADQVGALPFVPDNTAALDDLVRRLLLT